MLPSIRKSHAMWSITAALAVVLNAALLYEAVSGSGGAKAIAEVKTYRRYTHSGSINERTA